MKKIFNKLSNYFYYLKDIFFEKCIQVKLDGISFNEESHQIYVAYRIGRQRLMHKDSIKEFGGIHHAKLSVYDTQRFIKFLTLQNILDQFIIGNCSNYSHFMRFLQSEIKNDKLL